MRFPRNARIFRGQLDPAPFAGVFTLFLLFILLSSLLYTPGVLIELGNAAGNTGEGELVSINAKGEVAFAGKIYTEQEFDQLRSAVKRLPGSDPLLLKADSAAPAKVISAVRSLLHITPPAVGGFAGTDDPTAIVAVNLRGQLFFDNQIVTEDELRERLRNHHQQTQKQGHNLTLVVLADKAVENETILRLSAVARDVGIKNMMLAPRPGVLSSTPPRQK